MANTYKKIIALIESKQVTCEDFNQLIAESNEKSVRERVHRKTRVNPVSRHIKKRTGKSPFSAGKFSVAERTHPKLKPPGQQDHGDAERAHRRSTDTQRKNSEAGERPVKMIGDDNA